jgi:hypothetical protein
MAAIAVLFPAAVRECRFAVVPRGDQWTLFWRSTSGRSGSRAISADLAETLIRTSRSQACVSPPEPQTADVRRQPDDEVFPGPLAI